MSFWICSVFNFTSLCHFLFAVVKACFYTDKKISIFLIIQIKEPEGFKGTRVVNENNNLDLSPKKQFHLS